MTKAKEFIIYKIYYEDICVYVGRTSLAINDRLRGHFFGQRLYKAIDIHLVSKIETAKCKTQADMFIYEIYYINKLHPFLNCDDKAKDKVTLKLPELRFKKHDCHLLDKWRKIIKKDEAKKAKELEKIMSQFRKGKNVQ